MKTAIKITLITAILFITAACQNSKSTTGDGKIKVTGIIKEQGITSYQYGTHSISNMESFYAIKSENINLDEYIGQEVSIIAEKIPGYPVDGGPEYLQVLEVR